MSSSARPRSRNLLPRLLLAGVLAAGLAASPASRGEDFDLVIRGGRVMDPETGLDAIRDLGIRDGVIAAISAESLAGAAAIDAAGLVVSPGFIDLHQHAWDEDSIRLKALDGVTSILELEVGAADVERWYREREGRFRLHHGVAAGHIPVRMQVMGDFPSFLPGSASRAATEEASPEQLQAIQAGLARGLAAGAAAVGFGIAYTPAATEEEILAMFQVAADHGASCHVHLRGRRETALETAREVARASAATGAPLHIVHLQATGATATLDLLRLVEESRAAGQDVSAEVYPWTAGMTDIKSALFAEGWQDRFGLTWSDLQWGATGERLTEESFLRYRESGGLVIIHTNPESIVTLAVTHPATMIASDGLAGHPRNAGTYARVLGRYVRERGELDLMTALEKMTLMPARRLEARVPDMRRRGRVQEGCAADLTLFDPESVEEAATYEDAARPSRGIAWVLVDGVTVVERGQLVEEVRPGKAIRAPQAGN